MTQLLAAFTVLVAVLLVGLSAGASRAAQPPAPTPAPGGFTNPVINRDFPDPDILRAGDMYYAYATNSNGVNIQAARSADLVHWETLPDALPRLPAWAAQDFGFAWAPEVTTFDGEQYVMYHVARFQGVQCIGVAVSATSQGPFEPVGDGPLICQVEQGGSIDPAVFFDDGAPYLLWKNDGNAINEQTWIYLQSLAPDGLSLLGEPVPLLARDQPWEGRLIEAPTLWKHDGRYVLFYSANDYASSNYAVGYAAADALLGPYTKPPGNRVLKTDIVEGLVGPGGQDIVGWPDGSEWMLYHGWIPEGRAMFLAPLVWEDGVPAVLHARNPQMAPATGDSQE